jgi:hypothetical protein
VSRLNIYNKNKRLNNYARYGFTRFYFWFVNKPTVIALNSVQPELLESPYSAVRRCPISSLLKHRRHGKKQRIPKSTKGPSDASDLYPRLSAAAHRQYPHE